jgi:2-hydroxycyclohexanecarboxyl-CoA dehydrogenase
VKRPPLTLVTGATALVTGAGSGIGRATAHALAAGATVLCTDIDEAAAEKTAAECGERASAGSRAATAYRLDVADREEVDALAATVERHYGALGVLVNNAGVGMTGSFSDMTAEEWTFIRSINLDGVVNCCSAFTPPMLAAGRGQVVNVSSGLAFADGQRVRLRRHQGRRPPALAVPAGRLVRARCRCDRHLPRFHQHADRQFGPLHRGQGGPRRRARLVKGFSRAHPPEKVGEAIVKAIATNRALVPVGFESVLGWYAHRLTPIAFQQRIARLSGRP